MFEGYIILIILAMCMPRVTEAKKSSGSIMSCNWRNSKCHSCCCSSDGMSCLSSWLLAAHLSSICCRK